MAVDFPAIHQQIKQLGENAPLRERQLQALREKALELFESNATALQRLMDKVNAAVRYDPSLRCAMPVSEALNAHFPLPPLPGDMIILAADGSQINPDRNAEVDYCLINVGAVRICIGSPEPPKTFVESELYYDDQLYTDYGTVTEDLLAVKRDLKERSVFVDLVAKMAQPAVAITDGPIELWGVKDPGGGESSEFKKSLDAYLEVLKRLNALDIAAAGYVDKPGANLVVRLLELALMDPDQLPGVKNYHPLRGITEAILYRNLLQPGERSAVFAMQSQSAKFYAGPLALHFFYLNVGRPGRPWLARVEIPAWVAADPALLDGLHAALVNQCHVMGSRPYPYILHRAHETAVVSLEEKQQVTQMIVFELRRRGVAVGEASHKQAAKDLSGRTRYSG